MLYRKPTVVNMCPFVRIDEIDELSCSTVLIMHTAWPIRGEDYLIPDNKTTVKQLREITESGQLPLYVNPMLRRVQTSHEVRTNNGRPMTGTNENSAERTVDEDEQNGRDIDENAYDYDNDQQDDTTEGIGVVRILDTSNNSSIIESTWESKNEKYYHEFIMLNYMKLILTYLYQNTQIYRWITQLDTSIL
jgi:hypothetical protein